MDELIKQIYKVDLTLNDVQALTRQKANIIMYDDLTIDDNISSYTPVNTNPLTTLRGVKLFK